MQGVEEHNGIFAMPLLGVPEVTFSPTASDADPATVTWSIEVSHPEGIGAEIQNNTLYIWGNNSSWSGYGEVVLTGETPQGRSGSVAIPVTVFRQDRTLANVEGKKDYFVPWSPELDINRILSVEEHMLAHNKAEGELDRSIHWSSWKRLTFMKAMNCGTRWLNSSNLQGWTTERQLRTVDIVIDELKAMGVNWIKIDPCWFTTNLTSTTVIPLYDYSDIPTWTDEEIAYVVNEAHRRGISVLGSIQFWPLDNMRFVGHGRQTMRPADWGAWVESYQRVTHELGELYTQLGADMYCPGVELYNMAGEIDNAGLES